MNTLFYVAIWTLQFAMIFFFHYSLRHYKRHVSAQAGEILESHWLLMQTRDYLRDCDGFDARFLADKLNDHLQENWRRRGINENDFRELLNSKRQQVYVKG